MPGGNIARAFTAAPEIINDENIQRLSPTHETFTPVPDSFFRHLLSEIEDADELKVTLYALWRIEHMEGRFTPCAQRTSSRGCRG